MLLLGFIALFGVACGCEDGCDVPYAVSEDSFVSGTASLAASQTVKLTAILRLKEPLPEPGPTGSGGLRMSWSAMVGGTGGTQQFSLRTQVSTRDGDIDFTEGWILDSYAAIFHCVDGACERDLVMWIYPLAIGEDIEFDDPVALNWKWSAHVASISPTGEPPVELEILAQEVLPIEDAPDDLRG